MALNPNKELKLYYSIGEVAEMLGVSETLLRYWEKEFPTITPKKSGRNIRQYSQEDIEQVRLIHHLVKVKGMKLGGRPQGFAEQQGRSGAEYGDCQPPASRPRGVDANKKGIRRFGLIPFYGVRPGMSQSIRVTSSIPVMFFSLLQMVLTSSTSCTPNCISQSNMPSFVETVNL